MVRAQGLCMGTYTQTEQVAKELGVIWWCIVRIYPP
jgi:hypothetical protein